MEKIPYFFKDMIDTVFHELGGFKMRLSLPIPLFKFLMVTYQKIIRKSAIYFGSGGLPRLM